MAETSARKLAEIVDATGVIKNFESTGIDDNATSTKLTIDSSGVVEFYGPKMRFPTGTSDPATGLAGESYYNTTDKVLKIHNGTSWSYVAQGFIPNVFDPFADGSSEGFWKLDGNTNDEGGQYNGSIGGSNYSWTAGKSGSGLNLGQGGTNGDTRMYINSLGFKKDMTMSFWMQYHASTSADYGFFGFNSGQGANGFLFHFNKGASEFYIYHNSSGYLNPISVSSLSSWNHYCLTYDNNQTATVYLNGASQGTFTGLLTATSFNGQQVAVGGDMCCPGADRYTDATFDHIRWFNRALNATEVAKLSAEI